MNQTQTITRRAALERLAVLLGGALSAPLTAGLLGGCRAGGETAPAALQVFDADRFEFVSVLTDHIIPATDTPGARAAGVPAFIDEMLGGWFNDEDRQVFLDGLAEIDARAADAHGAPFTELDAAQQVDLLRVMDEAAYAPAPPPPPQEEEAEQAQQGTDAMKREDQTQLSESNQPGGDPQAAPPASATRPRTDGRRFFRMLKELTLAGYYTSQIGMTEELRWMPIPGRYDGDVPFEEVGRAWA